MKIDKFYYKADKTEFVVFIKLRTSRDVFRIAFIKTLLEAMEHTTMKPTELAECMSSIGTIIAMHENKR